MKILKIFPLFIVLTAICTNIFAENISTNVKTIKVHPTQNDMLSVGDTAPNIILKGKGGKKQLEKLRGKIVLVKFWASWCLPCRKTNPQWVNLYNNYKNAKYVNAKGFEIFAVSLDQQKKGWKKAIKADGLNYKNNTIDKKGWDSAYSFIYGINQLPSYFLLDANGKILAINPSPNEVQNILQKLLK